MISRDVSAEWMMKANVLRKAGHAPGMERFIVWLGAIFGSEDNQRMLYPSRVGF